MGHLEHLNFFHGASCENFSRLKHCMSKKAWLDICSNLLYKRGQDFLDGQYHLKDRTYFDIERFSFPVQQTYVWSTLEEVDFVM